MSDEAQAVLLGYNALESEYSNSAPILPCECGCGRPRPASKRRGRFPRAYATDACRARIRNRRIAQLAALGAKFARQPALPGASRVERRFAEWIETPAGRYVEAEVLKLAREDLADGYRRGEINLYLALVRRASRQLTKDRQGYACNQNHRAYLARRLMAGHGELRGFFLTRDLRGVA
jgi:hypothetical protein